MNETLKLPAQAGDSLKVVNISQKTEMAQARLARLELRTARVQKIAAL